MRSQISSYFCAANTLAVTMNEQPIVAAPALAFVEGSPTGIAMTELKVEEPSQAPAMTAPPPNPHFQPPTPAVGGCESPADFKRDVFTLDEGPVIIQWPERLSPASLEDFEAWLQLIVRRARRSVPITPEDDQ